MVGKIEIKTKPEMWGGQLSSVPNDLITSDDGIRALCSVFAIESAIDDFWLPLLLLCFVQRLALHQVQ